VSRGVDSLVFPVSRLLVDVKRFRSDEEEVMARVGKTGGRALFEACVCR
jgi:hypothetical protein